jgi:hypothetical protein
MGDIHHGHDARLVIDAIDDPVGAAAGAEAVVQRRQQLADAIRLKEEWAGGELASRRGHRFGKRLPERPPNRRRAAKFAGLV